MQSGQFQVGPDTVVHFSYRLFDEEEELVEGADAEILSFLFGYGQLAPALEEAMLGMMPGQERSVRLPPARAFGARDPEAIIEVDRAEFPPDVAPGDEFRAEREGGGDVVLMVLDVDAERVMLDTNHPLAGQTITLQVRVEAVRPALHQEIEEAIELLEAGQTGATSLLPAAGLLRRPSTMQQAASEEADDDSAAG